MNKQQFTYINAIYTIEDNIEEMKNYFYTNGFLTEYQKVIEIQNSFRGGIANKIQAFDKQHVN